MDARAGLTPLDEEIANWLRAAPVPVILLANKAEGRAGEGGVLEFYALGLAICRVFGRTRPGHGGPFRIATADSRTSSA